MSFSNICIFGNDNRMDYVAQKFYDMGYDVCRELEELNENSLVILPPPVGDEALHQVLPSLSIDQLVYGGAISNRFMHECLQKKIKCIDYLKYEDVIIKNAILTARGIVKEAESYHNISPNTKCLICGYGYCSKAIVNELKKHTPHISVMVRKKELKPLIEKEGYEYLSINDESNDFTTFDYIFNTVPALILDEEKLKDVKSGIILDIASYPGGTDFSYCESHNIRAILSLGIPGKMYPKDAGEIIAEAIIKDLNLM